MGRSKVRNPFEKKLASQLKRKKVKFSYESEKIPYIIAGHYVPDFVIQTPTGIIYIEAKGYFRKDDKRKLCAVKKCNPAKDIRIVFYKETKSNTRWAVKNNFPWAVEKVPLEWMKGF